MPVNQALGLYCTYYKVIALCLYETMINATENDFQKQESRAIARILILFIQTLALYKSFTYLLTLLCDAATVCFGIHHK